MTAKYPRLSPAYFSFVRYQHSQCLLKVSIVTVKMALLVLFFSMTSVVVGEVSTRVCEADGNTPFDSRDIMVGTRLTIIVSSDVNDNWPCDLAIQGTDRYYGVLSARDFNESTQHYDGSLLEAADDGAFVYRWYDSPLEIDGFSFTGKGNAGNWFIVDYNAIAIGDCNVGFYESLAVDPTYEIPFSHVRTRDFNKDTKVDFIDFAAIASYWQKAGCSDPNWCEGTDLDTDSNVDVNDLMLFVDYWLEKTQ
ncbi:MAG TPA: hypothetical protein ENH34_06835 [Phycisphaerales bacterium]|nr:hypothetical protein [Phycisphaerales bacterium]